MSARLSESLIVRRRKSAGVAPLLLVALLLGLIGAGCGAPTDDEQPIIPEPDSPTPEATIALGSVQLPVQILRTAASRNSAASRTDFGAPDNQPAGLLYVFPAGTAPRLELSGVPVDTDLLWLDEKGSTLNRETVPAAAQPIDGTASQNVNTRSLIGPQSSRYALQTPANMFSTESVRGTAFSLPVDVTGEGAPAPEDERAVYQLFYRPRGATGQQDYKTVQFGLHVVATAEQRDRWLSPSALDGLGDRDGLLVYYPTSRKIRLSVRDLPVARPFYLLPFTGDPRGSGQQIASPATAVEVRGLERNAELEPGQSVTWMQDPALRNWEYRSSEAYRGFVLIPRNALDSLNLPNIRSPFGMYDLRPIDGRDTLFGSLAQMDLPEAEPLRDVISASYTTTGGEGRSVSLKVLQSHEARLLGLRDAAPLRMASNDESGESSEGEADNSAGFDPELGSGGSPAHEGYLLRFPHATRRPLFTGSLSTDNGSAPYDVALLRANGSIARIISVRSDDGFYPSRETLVQVPYKSLWIMPSGWFQTNGLVSDGVATRNPLVIPAGLAIHAPEPARYPIYVGGQRVEVEVEIADQDTERMRGLMWRRDLPADSGMLFLFSREQQGGFWMLNCFMDLSTAYIRSDGRIGSIVDMFHPTLPPWETTVERDVRRANSVSELRQQSAENYQPSNSYRFVLEMSYGWFRQRGIESGERIEVSRVINELLAIAE